MVHTRSMSSIESTNVFASLIDDKFKELEISLIDEYKAALDNYFEQKKTEFEAFVAVNTHVSTIVSNDVELSESLQVMQNHVSELLRLKEEDNKLKDKAEVLEQYGRRYLRRYKLRVKSLHWKWTALKI